MVKKKVAILLTVALTTSLISISKPLAVKADVTGISTGLSFQATDGQKSDGNLFYKIDNNQVIITGCYVYSTEISIPNIIDGYPVTSIGDNAFKDCIFTRSISIPDSVINIGANAFEGCIGIDNIRVPSHLTSIQDGTFENCSNLTNVEIPDGVISIGNRAFGNCAWLESVYIPNTVGIIADNAFELDGGFNTGLIIKGYVGTAAETYANSKYLQFKPYVSSISLSKTSIMIKAGETTKLAVSYTPSNSEFGKGCTFSSSDNNIASVDKDGNVTGVNSGTATITATTEKGLKATCIVQVPSKFGVLTYVRTNNEVTITGCDTSATTVVVPETIDGYSVTSIGKDAFKDCKAVTSISLPASIKSIGENAFENCWYLIKVNIPNGVTSIQNCTFSSCVILESIDIPDSVTSIGNGAFDSCMHLKSIYIPKNVTSIPGDAFQFCDELAVIQGYAGTAAEQFAKSRNITFRKYVSNISFDKPNLTIAIGETVKPTIVFTPSDAVLGKGYSLTSSNANIVKVDGSGQLIGVNPGTATITATTEKGVTATCTVGVTNQLIEGKTYHYGSLSYVFKNNEIAITGLDNVYEFNLKIPEKINGYPVTSIADDAFSESYYIDSVELPKTIKSIGAGAFAWSSLVSIKMADGITNIGDGAFEECYLTGDLVLPESLQTIGDYAFDSCNLSSIYIPSNVKSIGNNAFALNNRDFVIKSYLGSVAETYAKTNSIKIKTYVGGITLGSSLLNINVGDTKNLTVSFTPSSSELGKGVTFTSSDEKIVKVDNTGKIVGVNPGTATITATSEKGLTSTCTVVVAKELKINSYNASLESPQVAGTGIKLSMAAEGQGEVKYSFEVKKDGKRIFVTSFSNKDNVIWTPTTAGKYRIYFKTKDESGRQIQQSVKYVVNKKSNLEVKSLTISKKATNKVGSAIKITANAEGKGEVKYKFIIFKDGKLINSTSYNTKNYSVWTPTKAGTYAIWVRAIDSTGTVSRKTIEYVVE